MSFSIFDFLEVYGFIMCSTIGAVLAISCAWAVLQTLSFFFPYNDK